MSRYLKHTLSVKATWCTMWLEDNQKVSIAQTYEKEFLKATKMGFKVRFGKKYAKI